MKDLTEAQEQALSLMRQPAYMADGTKINDNTGRALAQCGLARWSDNEQAWKLTEEGWKEVLK